MRTSIARSLYLPIQILIRQCTNLVRSNCGSLFCCQTPCVATDTQHSSNKHDMCRSFCNQSEITTYIARSRLKRSAFSWRHERIKRQTQGASVAADNWRSSRNDNLFCNCCNHQVRQPRRGYCAQRKVALESLSILRMPSKLQALDHLELYLSC